MWGVGGRLAETGAPSRASTRAFTSATVADAPTCRVSVRPAQPTVLSATGEPERCATSQGLRRLTRPDENLHGAPWPVLSKLVAVLAPDEEAVPAKPAA